MTIYADYQATTPLDPRVADAMRPHWSDSFGNPHSSDHAVGWKAAETLRAAAETVAALIGGDADEVIFTSGATESNNMALQGLARRAPPGRNKLLVSKIEHKCVLATATAMAEREGLIVETLPVDGDGLVDLDAVGRMVDDTTLVVSVMAVNNEIGTIQDIESIARITAEKGVPLHCDAAQAPCAVELGNFAEHADMISLSAHKMYGPPGIGVLYLRRNLHDRLEPLIYGGGQQNGLRSGTVPVPLCIGLAHASELMNTADALTEREQVRNLRDRFVSTLQGCIPRVKLNGAVGSRRHPGNANLRFDGTEAQDIIGRLQPHLAAAQGAACASGIPEPSHVLSAIGLTAEESQTSIRFSFGRFTDLREVDEAAELVIEAWRETKRG